MRWWCDGTAPGNAKRIRVDWVEASNGEAQRRGLSGLSQAGRRVTQGRPQACVLVLAGELKGQDEETIECEQPLCSL